MFNFVLWIKYDWVPYPNVFVCTLLDFFRGFPAVCNSVEMDWANEFYTTVGPFGGS